MLDLKKSLLLFCFMLFIFFTIAPKASASLPIIRLGGSDRYETAIKISQDSFAQSDFIVLASGQDFPDALCAAPLAKKYNAPILLTQGNSLNSSVSQEIKRLGARNAYIVGGIGVISQNIENQLSALNINYTRIEGQDRYETSVKVAEIIGSGNGVVLSSGDNFPDALSIASIAAVRQMPILLTSAYTLPTSVRTYICNNSISKYYVVGGNAVVSDNALYGLPNIKRLSGSDRYATNLAIVNEFSKDVDFSNVYLATGENFADALGGSASAAKSSSPIILVDKSCKAQDLIQSKLETISLFKVLGGTSAVSDTLAQNMSNPSKVVVGFATYYFPGDNSSYNSLVNYSKLIDTVATETFSTDGLGNINGIVPANVVNYANSNKIITLAMITNYFNGEIAKTLLESPDNRQRLINNILTALRANNYKGVNIDIEGVHLNDRAYFTTFINELCSALQPQGFTVTVAIPAKVSDITNAWSGAYDYAQIGMSADKVMLMTYDEHWSGGSPGPIASINWVQSVINYTLAVIPREKILLGISAYAYDWPSNGMQATALGISHAYDVASAHGAQIQWDPVSESPYFNYTDSTGIYHNVWFENSTSIGYKLDIVNNYKLNGIAIWRLGLEDSDFWTTISTKFNK